MASAASALPANSAQEVTPARTASLVRIVLCQTIYRSVPTVPRANSCLLGGTMLLSASPTAKTAHLVSGLAIPKQPHAATNDCATPGRDRWVPMVIKMMMVAQPKIANAPTAYPWNFTQRKRTSLGMHSPSFRARAPMALGVQRKMISRAKTIFFVAQMSTNFRRQARRKSESAEHTPPRVH